MIKVVKIDKYFNRLKKNKIHVINNTSLDFNATGLVALLGPSGSGKTTLLNVIGGLDKVRKGSIYINGKKITRRSQRTVDKIRNLNIGYIFQDYKLIEDQSVYDNVAISLRLIGIKDKAEIKKRVTYILEKVGMLRFKNRPCNMLSGGERQRVGIARAIAKNPNIVIADEPTGNLDSKNSIEIMNIIKAISKDKLVILVTHEKELAKFYASRIIELEDGKIVKDYENEILEELNYGMFDNIYLKDFNFKEEYDNIHVYSNNGEKVSLEIAVLHNNIYIRTNTNKKIEVIGEDSTIEMIDDHRKNISKEDVEKYHFDYQNMINEPKKIKYSSIFNPITFITSGFKKVLNYSFMKKMLLGGFFASGFFIMFAAASTKAIITIKDEKFVEINKNYLIIETKKINVDDYLKLEQDPDIEYIIPTNSIISLKVKTDDFYQVSQLDSSIEGSLSSTEMITKDDIIYGRFPENKMEIVVDKMVLENALKKSTPKMMGLLKAKDYLDREVILSPMDNKKIVGIVDCSSPSIYMERSDFIWVLNHVKDVSGGADYLSMSEDYAMKEDSSPYDDYFFYRNDFWIKEGRLPENPYEIIVDISRKGEVKLNQEINQKVNDHKLTVVGFYDTKTDINTSLVDYTTMKYYIIKKSSNIAVYPKDKEKVLDKVTNEYQMTIKDSYTTSREQYLKANKTYMKSVLITAGIILAISLIEILLMIRSSFLSRVKEVGIYRAIGVKKKDIYIMFMGEIIAITTMASVPGLLLSAYIFKILSGMIFLKDYFLVTPDVILGSIILLYLFNMIVGLLPVFNTMRKRPAEILARTDI